VTYHWFKTPFPVDMRAVWARATPTSIQGSSQPSALAWQLNLSPYDTLAYLCLHLGLHGLQIMKSFLDIDLFLHSLPSDWDWSVYLDLVEKWHIRSISFHAFSFCQNFFDTSIPEDVLQALEPSNFDRWQMRLLISPEGILGDRQTLGTRYPTLAKFALIDNTRSKAKTLWHVFLPDRSIISRSAKNHTIFDHWRHIYRVIKRGD
jgi:hypothetical protein